MGWVIGLISLGGNNIQKLRSASQEKIICFLFRMCDLHLKFLDLQTVLNWYILWLLFKKFFLGVAYLEFIFLESLVFCFSHVSCVDVGVSFLVICVLGLVVLPEERGSLLLNHSVLFWVFLWQRKKFLWMLLIFLMYNHCQKTVCDNYFVCILLLFSFLFGGWLSLLWYYYKALELMHKHSILCHCSKDTKSVSFHILFVCV